MQHTRPITWCDFIVTTSCSSCCFICCCCSCICCLIVKISDSTSARMPADAPSAAAAAAVSRARTDLHPTAAYIKFCLDILTHAATETGVAELDAGGAEGNGDDTIIRINVSIVSVWEAEVENGVTAAAADGSLVTLPITDSTSPRPKHATNASRCCSSCESQPCNAPCSCRCISSSFLSFSNRAGLKRWAGISC